ncbi:3-deoxy-manno-octulosonate cytidylyltransferase, partial [bacterium]|nr:3-deoxy-manno-octulosonate cytidylyltransferase [bacterium]
LPGKALADLGGRPLVVRVAELAARMETADEVIVATDDARIVEAVESAGHRAEMTGDHPTGSDRVAEVLERHHAEIVLDLQGDEPLLEPSDLDALVRSLLTDPEADMATLAHPLSGPDEWRDPNVVKVLAGGDGHALWFSRAAIPGVHAGLPHDLQDGVAEPWRMALRHVGVYAFRGPSLKRFLNLPRTALERAEGLEQLRALEHGLRIQVAPAAGSPVGVDTPEDLERVRELWSRRG